MNVGVHSTVRSSVGVRVLVQSVLKMLDGASRQRLSASCWSAPGLLLQFYQSIIISFLVFIAIPWSTLPTAAASPMSNVIVGAFGGDTIALGNLDMKSGALHLSSFSKAAGPAASFFAWLSNQQQTPVLNVLAGNEAGPGSAVTAVQLQGLQSSSAIAGTAKQTTGVLAAVQLASLPADSPCHVAIHSSGRWALSASYPAGTITVMEVITILGLSPSSAAPAVGGAATAQLPRMLLRKAATMPRELVGQAAHQAALAGTA